MIQSRSSRIDMSAVGKRLRQLIQVQYPSIGDFADVIGVSRNTLYRLTGAGLFPSVPTLVDICDVLGCSVDFLLGLSSPEADAVDAYKTAALNIHEFGSQWNQEDRFALSAAAAGLMTEPQEEKLLNRRIIPVISPANRPKTGHFS